MKLVNMNTFLQFIKNRKLRLF